MKKVLLSLSMLAAVMSANAQSVKVGVGIYDDFATTGNPTDNPGGEYSTPVDATNTAGIFWYTDADYASTYTKTRANGVMTIDVTAKGTEYSVVGCGFGDDNGTDDDGNPFYIDITGNKNLSVNLKSTTAAGVKVAVQIVDINNVALEISADNNAAGEKLKYEANVTTTAKDFTFNFGTARAIDHSVGNNDPDFDNGYVCGAAWPADCPVTLATNPFDYTKVTKINFLISGGTAYTGTVTFDNLKLGSVNNVGLDTKSAAANVASTRVFPNPSTSAFTAEVSLKNAATTSIILSDLVGKQISTKSVDASGQASFETSGLAAGTYVVTYVVDGAPAKSELVVVK